MKEYDVLLTNPCGYTGELVAASLSKAGLKVDIMEAPSAKKRADLYIGTLKERLKQHPSTMVIPVFFPEVLASRRSEFPGTLIPLDSAAKINALDDKISACSLAASLGIPQPVRYTSLSGIEVFPVVVKRPRGQGGDSVYFPRSAKALEYLLRISSPSSPSSPSSSSSSSSSSSPSSPSSPSSSSILPLSCLVTEYIEGDDYCVDALRWDGYFRAEAYKVLQPKGKGVSRLRIGVIEPVLVEYVRRILDAVDYHGVCGVDFRIDKAGNAFFLECNPRFSGGIESALASGFDIPYIYYCLACGLPVRETRFTPGIVTGSDTISK